MANSKKSLCNSVCDIFSMLQSTKDIDQAKKDLKHPKKASLSHCDVDKIIAEINHSLIMGGNDTLNDSILKCFEKYIDHFVSYHELFFENNQLIHDLLQEATLSAYYAVCYLNAKVKPFGDFLRHSIPEYEGMALQDEKKRIIQNANRHQKYWYFPLLNISYTEKQNVSFCLLFSDYMNIYLLIIRVIV